MWITSKTWRVRIRLWDDLEIEQPLVTSCHTDRKRVSYNTLANASNPTWWQKQNGTPHFVRQKDCRLQHRSTSLCHKETAQGRVMTTCVPPRPKRYTYRMAYLKPKIKSCLKRQWVHVWRSSLQVVVDLTRNSIAKSSGRIISQSRLASTHPLPGAFQTRSRLSRTLSLAIQIILLLSSWTALQYSAKNLNE